MPKPLHPKDGHIVYIVSPDRQYCPARTQAHMPATHVSSPTPSPDGLCQAGSAASLMPQCLLEQELVRAQLARAWGAAGMLRGIVGSTKQQQHCLGL